MPNPSKLTITAFKVASLTQQVGDPYEVKVNPTSYSQDYRVQYDKEGAIGGSNTTLKFSKMPPQTVKFELLFDGTGVVTGSSQGVWDEIQDFLKVVYDYNGTTHEPYYLKLHWGQAEFSARLTDLSIQYTLFSESGKPLRAKAKSTFMNFIDPKALARKQGEKSPDVTHEVVVRAGDTLPQLCHQIYGDAHYYPQVAAANGLLSVHPPAPGTRLLFPAVRT